MISIRAEMNSLSQTENYSSGERRARGGFNISLTINALRKSSGERSMAAISRPLVLVLT